MKNFEQNLKTEKIRGFTLVELLVVVTIIAVLVGGILIVMNPAQVRGRARDSQRIADIRTLQTALEEFYRIKRFYPVSTGFYYVSSTGGVLYTSLTTGATKVLDKIPVDPTDDSTSLASPCATPTSHRYNYGAPDAGNSQAQKYVLTAIMESPTSNNGFECGRLTNWVSGFVSNMCSSSGTACTGTGNGLGGEVPNFASCDYCYGVENR